MAKNKYKDQPIVLTVTIPTDGSGVCKMSGSFVDLGIVRQFDYTDQNDIAAALQAAAWDLVDMSTNPPPAYDAPKGNQQAAPATQQEVPAPEMADSEAVGEGQEAAEAQTAEEPVAEYQESYEGE